MQILLPVATLSLPSGRRHLDDPPPRQNDAAGKTGTRLTPSPPLSPARRGGIKFPADGAGVADGVRRWAAPKLLYIEQ